MTWVWKQQFQVQRMRVWSAVQQLLIITMTLGVMCACARCRVKGRSNFVFVVGACREGRDVVYWLWTHKIKRNHMIRVIYPAHCECHFRWSIFTPELITFFYCVVVKPNLRSRWAESVHQWSPGRWSHVSRWTCRCREAARFFLLWQTYKKIHVSLLEIKPP